MSIDHPKDILSCFAALRDKNNRYKAAKELSTILNVEEILVFIWSPAVSRFLPAQGFPQILQNGKEWKTFLNSSTRPIFQGTLYYPDLSTLKEALAIRSEKCIAVLLGGQPSQTAIEDLLKLLPLLESLLSLEQEALVNNGISKVAAHSAEKSERLAVALDIARKDVLKTLEENRGLIKSLQEKNEILVRINNDLDNFIYTASHDLKAPVSNIEGLVTVLTESLASKSMEETEMVLGLIKTSIKKFKDTIQDLTEIGKAQREINEIEQVNINEVLVEVKEVLASTIKEKNAVIECKILAENISFSRKNLRSIIYNLLSNALKYSSPSRTPYITFTTKKIPGYFVVEVSDNGLGIKKVYLEKLFTMFKRFHTHVEGSGVGLYIIKRIIENADGKIEVKSQENIGSTFRVFLKAK